MKCGNSGRFIDATTILQLVCPTTATVSSTKRTSVLNWPPWRLYLVVLIYRLCPTSYQSSPSCRLDTARYFLEGEIAELPLHIGRYQLHSLPCVLNIHQQFLLTHLETSYDRPRFFAKLKNFNRILVK